MQKIIVTGAPGSGKSVLADQVGTMLKIEVTHLDSLFWKPGWVKTSEQYRLKVLKEIVKEDRWILEGKYINTFDFQLSVAEVVVFMDFPRYVYLWHIFKRHLYCTIKKCPDVAPDCPYKIRWEYIKSLWSYPYKERKIFLEKIERSSNNKCIVKLHNFAELSVFLHELSQLKLTKNQFYNKDFR